MSRPSREPTLSQYLQAVRDGAAEPPASASLIGVDLLDVGDGTATFGLTPAAIHDNGTGIVHGGILATLIDFAAVSAVNDVPVTTSVSTASLNLVYLHPVPTAAGPVRAEASLVHRGRRTNVAEVRLIGDDGSLLAVATATVVVARERADPLPR